MMWTSVDQLWSSLCFLNLEVCFLLWVREVFSYYLFKYNFCPFLSSPSGTHVVQMFLPLMWSKSSLNQSSFLLSFFLLFAAKLGCSALFCLPDCWAVLLHPLIGCWFPLGYFSFQLLLSTFLLRPVLTTVFKTTTCPAMFTYAWSPYAAIFFHST